MANQALFASLSDPDPRLRIFALRALGWPGNTAAVAPIVKVLANRKDYRVVEAAVAALGEIGPAGLPDLLQALGGAGQDDVARFQITRACVAMGAPAVAQLIAALSSNDPNVRKWCATALGSLGDKQAVPALRRLEQTSQGDLHWAAQEQIRLLTGHTD